MGGSDPGGPLGTEILTEPPLADALTPVVEDRGGSIFCPRGDLTSYGGAGSVKEPAGVSSEPRLSHGLLSTPSVVGVGKVNS